MTNLCAGDGWLVNARLSIPTDGSEYEWDGREPIVGCSRLRCSVCGADVRNHADYLVGTFATFGTPEWRSRTDAMYDTADWSALDFVQREPGYRAYICRCGPVDESWQRPLAGTSVDGTPNGQPIPWKCQGHAVLSLPCTVDGVDVRDEASLASLVARALGGWAPSLPTGETAPEGWARRLLYRLEGGDAAEIVRKAARAALSSTDAGVRLGAIRFFRTVVDVEAARLLWAAARAEESAPGDAEISAALVQRAAEQWAAGTLSDGEARDFVRRQATTAGRAAAVLPSLVFRDVDWLREHYAEVARANPESAASVIVRLFNALAWSGFAIEDVARTVASIPGVSREQLRTEVSKGLFGEARKRVLDAIGEGPLN